MGEVDSVDLSRYSSRATRVAVALALGRRYFVGPDVLEPPSDHPHHRSWLTAHTRVETFTEWTDPVRGFSVYALPQDLRPGQLPPIVRRTTWRLNRTKHAADKEHFFDKDAFTVEYFFTGSQFASELDDKMSLFVAGLDSLHSYDSISPTVRDDSPARAVKYMRIGWGTRLEVIDLQWSAEDYPARTELLAPVWETIDAECQPVNALADWTPFYDVPIELAFAEPDRD